MRTVVGATCFTTPSSRTLTQFSMHHPGVGTQRERGPAALAPAAARAGAHARRPGRRRLLLRLLRDRSRVRRPDHPVHGRAATLQRFERPAAAGGARPGPGLDRVPDGRGAGGPGRPLPGQVDQAPAGLPPAPAGRAPADRLARPLHLLRKHAHASRYGNRERGVGREGKREDGEGQTRYQQ